MVSRIASAAISEIAPGLVIRYEPRRWRRRQRALQARTSARPGRRRRSGHRGAEQSGGAQARPRL